MQGRLFIDVHVCLDEKKLSLSDLKSPFLLLTRSRAQVSQLYLNDVSTPSS
jgi:hypothetical protein